MNTLYLDTETFSKNDLPKCGLYRYMESVEIIIFTYAFDDEPVITIDLLTQRIPERVLTAIPDPNYRKIAHNAPFDMAALAFCYPDLDIDPLQWFCSQVLCAVAGLPQSLEKAAKVLKLDQQKDVSGKSLINFFSKPCMPTKANGFHTRNFPIHDLYKWATFKDYGAQDTETMRAIVKHLWFIRITPIERRLWALDYKINRKGIKIDKRFAHNAIRLDLDFRTKLIAEAIKITNLENPNSVAQIKKWLETETETENIGSLKKENIEALIAKFESKKAKRILEIRQQLSKTSVKKYTAMINALGILDRLRGLFQFYGAGRTGRWAGRLVQAQNLVRGIYKGKMMDWIRKLILEADSEMLYMAFGAISETLAQLLRTAFIAERGHRFIVADFSAIEARVIAWLSDERWRLDVFKTHGKIYEAGAALILHKRIEDITEDERQKVGKISELALGFGGGVEALKRMNDQYKAGLKEEQFQPIVDGFRAANPKIKQFWKDCENKAKEAIKTGEKTFLPHGLNFQYKDGNLYIGLPSGRSLCYYKAKLVPGKYAKEDVAYWGVNQSATSNAKKWMLIRTYGGKIAENIVQAVARDCLAQGMLNVDAGGYDIVLHAHDEIVTETLDGDGSAEEVCALMCTPEPWMRGLPLKATVFESYYYKKG